MVVPRLGVDSELQLPAYTTATATWDLSRKKKELENLNIGQLRLPSLRIERKIMKKNEERDSESCGNYQQRKVYE